MRTAAALLVVAAVAASACACWRYVTCPDEKTDPKSLVDGIDGNECQPGREGEGEGE